MQNRGQRTGRRTVAAMAAAGLIMAMSVGLLTGCSDTKIVVTTGLASNELFRSAMRPVNYRKRWYICATRKISMKMSMVSRCGTTMWET